jgi:hypothetical protein
MVFVPFAGITRIRYDGFTLSPFPPKRKTSTPISFVRYSLVISPVKGLGTDNGAATGAYAAVIEM